MQDMLRGFSLHYTNDTADDVEKRLSFPQGAKVFSLQIKCWGEADTGEVTLKLKDSSLVVTELHDLDMDFPNGIMLPAFMQVVVPPGVKVSLMMGYGGCNG